MALSNIPIPFKLSDVYGGFGTVKGLIYVKQDQLQIDFQSEDSILGLVKSKPKVIDIPLTQVESFELKTSTFRTRLILRVFSLEAIDDFPRPSGNVPAGELRFSLKRADRERAKDVVSYVKLRLSEIKLDRLDSDDLY